MFIFRSLKIVVYIKFSDLFSLVIGKSSDIMPNKIKIATNARIDYSCIRGYVRVIYGSSILNSVKC